MEKIESGPIRVIDTNSHRTQSALDYGRDPHTLLAISALVLAIAVIGLVVLGWMVAF